MDIVTIGAGLAINLRYIYFFGLVYILLMLYPQYKKIFFKIGISGALIVLIFAILQVFVLPNDVLKFLGYNSQTIAPFLTVDQNYDFIRINSTLRGPNPLGAYAVIVITLTVSLIVKIKKSDLVKCWPLIAILSLGGLVALIYSYSRSAMVAVIVAILTVLIAVLYKKISGKIWLLGVGLLLALISGLYLLFGNSYYFSNVFLHENPGSSSLSSSNVEHIGSLQDGFRQLLAQPFGAGIGTTGSASLYGSQPEIIENQYLFIAHESGWFGLVLFLFIFVSILKKLWQGKDDWLVIGVFASGIGLALIGLVLPVWVDDTVSIIWWGMAAVALFVKFEKKI
jgi:hypothetical protein